MKEQQVQQKQNKLQRPLSTPETLATAELTLAETGLQNPGQMMELPNHPTSRSIRQATVLHMQQQHGNGTVQRENGSGPKDAGTLPAGVPPAPAAAPTAATFTKKEFSRKFGRFDAKYKPVAPMPKVGDLRISLKVHITFANISRVMMRKEPFKSHRFTSKQLADFAWTKTEKESFESDFVSSARNGWSNKHILRLQEPGFAKYRSRVEVDVVSVSDPGLAHTKITAQKVPKGAPRLRSSVKGDKATLDICDPSVLESKSNDEADYIRQVGPFGFNSSKLTPKLSSQLEKVKDGIKPLLPAVKKPDDLNLTLTGRASSEGRKSYNERLADKRANEVAGYLRPDIGLSMTIVAGEENATRDKKFRRVDVAYSKPSRKSKQLKQNVAAHEAGHMFGLGDEYVEEKPKDPDLEPKFLADKPTHHGVVKTVLGTETADDLLVQNSNSIMSHGNQVKRGHYIPFVAAILKMTGKKWTVGREIS
ncbi:MAG: OmpA family protein [Chloroflexi bacterium]|nr:OmpA family protein [Chloroflexota bacterium]